MTKTPAARMVEDWFAQHREFPTDHAWAENLVQRVETLLASQCKNCTPPFMHQCQCGTISVQCHNA